MQFAFSKTWLKITLGNGTFIPENNKRTCCFTMKIDLRKLETAFPGWSASFCWAFYPRLLSCFIQFSTTVSCHWLSVDKFEWKIRPSFELGTWNIKPRQFYRWKNHFVKSQLLTCKIRHSLSLYKSRKEIVKTVTKIIKILPGFLVVCRKLGCAFFIGAL